ncbi:hypothetical protein BH24CHL6_BH24CHL6_08810 [soil metagenome]
MAGRLLHCGRLHRPHVGRRSQPDRLHDLAITPGEGILRCDDASVGGVRRPVVSIESPTDEQHGIWYALNGAAHAAGLPALDDAVWNGNMPALQPLIKRGLELCK